MKQPHILKKLSRNRLALLGLLFVMMILISACFGSIIAPYDPFKMDFDKILEPPSRSHIMGTDLLGRDIFSRVLYGARYALLIGVGVVGLQMLIGGMLGLMSGFWGGIVDNIVMRLVDVVWAVPGIVLALALAGALGGGIWVMIIAIASTGWGQFTRLIRGQVLAVRELDFVTAAKAVGARRHRIMFRHILPNVVGPIIVYTTLEMPTAVLASAALSFLGVGAQPPTPEWGAMIAEGRALVGYAWWVSTFPGLAIMLLALGFNFLGDGLRDALDPKFERRI